MLEVYSLYFNKFQDIMHFFMTYVPENIGNIDIDGVDIPEKVYQLYQNSEYRTAKAGNWMYLVQFHGDPDNKDAVIYNMFDRDGQLMYKDKKVNCVLPEFEEDHINWGEIGKQIAKAAGLIFIGYLLGKRNRRYVEIPEESPLVFKTRTFNPEEHKAVVEALDALNEAREERGIVHVIDREYKKRKTHSRLSFGYYK